MSPRRSCIGGGHAAGQLAIAVDGVNERPPRAGVHRLRMRKAKTRSREKRISDPQAETGTGEILANNLLKQMDFLREFR